MTFCRANQLFIYQTLKLMHNYKTCNSDDPSPTCKGPTFLQIAREVPSLMLRAALEMQSLFFASDAAPIEWEIDWKMAWVQGNNSPEHRCNRIIHLGDIFPCQSKCNYVCDIKE